MILLSYFLMRTQVNLVLFYKYSLTLVAACLLIIEYLFKKIAKHYSKKLLLYVK